MAYQAGDRVMSLIDDGAGLRKGEYGTVRCIDNCCGPVVDWDEYSPIRHDSGGYVRNGHGWYVTETDICIIVNDLGEFQPSGSIDLLLS